MNTATDAGTPIFGELSKEFGELPEIDIHDFDWHGVDIGQAASENADTPQETAEQGKVISSGGKRRKEP